MLVHLDGWLISLLSSRPAKSCSFTFEIRIHIVVKYYGEMGSSVSRDYLFGVGLGMLGSVVSAPIYGAWPSPVHILVIHPTVSIVCNHVGRYVSKPPKRPMWVEHPVQFSIPGLAIHWAAVSAVDLLAGAATPTQVAYTFASGVLMNCYAFGLQDVTENMLGRFSGNVGTAVFTGVLCSTYLAFGFTMRAVIMNWNTIAGRA